MHPQITRRRFLKRSVQAGCVVAAAEWCAASSVRAIEPFRRPGSPRLLLGLAAYSLRDYFKDIDYKREKSPTAADQLDMLQFVDYCADHGCQGAEVTSYYFPKDLTEEFLIRLKRRAFMRGIAISGTAIGNTFTHPSAEKRVAEIAHTKKWIDYAAVMGAPHIRVFAGGLQGNSKEEAKNSASLLSKKPASTPAQKESCLAWKTTAESSPRPMRSSTSSGR